VRGSDVRVYRQKEVVRRPLPRRLLQCRAARVVTGSAHVVTFAAGCGTHRLFALVARFLSASATPFVFGNMVLPQVERSDKYSSAPRAMFLNFLSRAQT